MLPILFAAAAAASGPAAPDSAAFQREILAACQISLKAPGTDVPKGFCSCFAKATAAEAAALTPRQRTVFLLLTQNAGDPIGAQKQAQTRHNIGVEDFASDWDKLNPIGQKAGASCSKPKGRD